MRPDCLVWIGILFGSIVLLELIRLNFLLYSAFKKDLKLPDSGHCDPDLESPSITVVVPAKDEEDHIETVVRTILSSNYPHLELILVDDRSSDDTLEIMEKAARDDARVRVMSIRELPPEWTGKTHAMFQAAKTASSDILLFTDADAVFEKDLISRAVNFMIGRNLDMLSLLPGFLERGFLEDAVHLHLALGLSSFYPLMKVNDEGEKEALASGCFIMIRKEAYYSVGTWEHFRRQVTEDIALGKDIKARGLKLNVLRGQDLIRTKPFETLKELIGFWRRTFYGGLEKSIPKMIKLCLNYITLIVLFGLSIYSGAVLEEGAGDVSHAVLFAISTAVAAVVMISYGIVIKKEHGKPVYGFSAPIGLVIGAWIAVSTFAMVLSNRGVSWRGSVYK